MTICAVLTQLCDLPLWLLPGVTALSVLVVSMCWGPMARRLVSILAVIAVCGFMGLMLAVWYFVRDHGMMLPVSSEGVERREIEEFRAEMIGTGMGSFVGLALVLTQGWRLRRSDSNPSKVQ